MTLDSDALGRDVTEAIRAAVAEFLRTSAADLSAMTEQQARAVLAVALIHATPLGPAPTTMQAAAEQERILAARSVQFARVAAIEAEFGPRLAAVKGAAQDIALALLKRVGQIGIAALLAAL
jgi:hypothetical protein